MARGLSSSSRRRSRTPYDATLLAADRIISKEREYVGQIERMQAAALQLAEKISFNGDVQKALLDNSDVKVGNKDQNEERKKANEDIEHFLKEQREKVKALSVGNVKRLQDVELFVKALGSIRDDIRTKQDIEGNESASLEETDAINNPPDYQLIIKEKMEDLRENAKNNDISEDFIYEHRYCRNVRERLGEKEKKRKPRRSRGGYDDEEDELEIIDSNTNDNQNSLKCPMTGTLFENPLRNKVCGHVYSKAGFEMMLQTRNRKCPVVGCLNQNVTRAQLEEDYEMEMRVKRYKNRIQREKQAQNEFSDGEDEDQPEESVPMTVIS